MKKIVNIAEEAFFALAPLWCFFPIIVLIVQHKIFKAYGPAIHRFLDLL